MAKWFSHVCTREVVQETASANYVRPLIEAHDHDFPHSFVGLQPLASLDTYDNASGNFKKRWSTSNSWNLHCWNLQSPISQISKDEILKPQLSHQQIIARSSKKTCPLDWGRFHCFEQPGLVSTGGARCWCLHGSWRLQCHCCQSYQLLDSCWREQAQGF